MEICSRGALFTPLQATDVLQDPLISHLPKPHSVGSRGDQLQPVTRTQAQWDFVDWIEGLRNRFKRHSSIGYRTPVGKKLGLNAT